jgi:pimeloyl-ACP methyl ester carboxylesterase
VIAAATMLARTDAVGARAFKDAAAGAGIVHALFNPDDPDASPFPTDIFTVADSTHNTGRRLALPYPDCTSRVSDCEDLDVVNTLDGFGLQPQISIPFDGPIDVGTVDSQAVLLLNLGSPRAADGAGPGGIVGIAQVVWDTFTHTLLVETDELLEQHTRYALIATNRLRDTQGRPVEPSDVFRRFRQTVRGDYKQALLEALQAARRHGIVETEIVAASVFTTQSITSVMEKIRDQIKADTPDGANFLLGPMGERAVFNRADVTSIFWSQHTGVDPLAFTTVPINLQLLQIVPGAVGTIAFGYYESPDYLVHPGEYMPEVGTRTGTPVVQGYNRISFTLFLPTGAPPPGGWPIAITGHSASGNQHQTSALVASVFASEGIAAIGINNPGNGFGPLSTLTINLTDGRSLTVPAEGRGIDQNGDGVIGFTEGSAAAPPRAWAIQERDSYRQLTADMMQLVRVMEAGIDVDGDGSRDLDPNRIYFFGASAGAMFGTMFAALEPAVSAAVLTVPGGLTPEHARWAPVRRSFIGGMLQGRIPSLINAPGVTAIDGVSTPLPHFDENKPAWGAAPVTNTRAGAIAIQQALELQETTSQSGITPVVWAPHLRERPLPGLAARPVLFQSAEGDQNAVSNGTNAILRAGGLADLAVRYRHDLASAEDPTIPKNPHTVLAGVAHPNPFFRAIARGLMNQAAAFLASGGTVIVHPEPAHLFEVPIRTPLPEELNFIK